QQGYGGGPVGRLVHGRQVPEGHLDQPAHAGVIVHQKKRRPRVLHRRPHNSARRRCSTGLSDGARPVPKGGCTAPGVDWNSRRPWAAGSTCRRAPAPAQLAGCRSIRRPWGAAYTRPSIHTWAATGRKVTASTTVNV